MSNFRQCDRETPNLLPPSLDDWLPADHLARFVVDIVEQLDLSPLARQYRDAGSAAYHPSVLIGLLVYSYATGTFGSRRIEQATYESLAFRYVAANTHPDYDTLCTFRKRFVPEIESLFVQVLSIARQMKLLKLGTVALDGTKLHANASPHSALSYGHAGKIEALPRREVQELLARAEAADLEPLPAGMSISEELARRDARLQAIRAAKAELETRAAERHAAELADYEAKLKARADNTERTGKKPRGKPSAPPCAGGRANDQVNLTDPDSRIMPVAGGGFEPCYNAQAADDADTMLVVATGLTLPASDKQQIAPMITALNELPGELGEIVPMLTSERKAHHPRWQTRFSEPPPLAAPADPIAGMKHRLLTRAGPTWYALRKRTVEPVFGIIQAVMGFRQFLLRGLHAVRGEWSLVTMAWNIRRMAALRDLPRG